MLQPEDRSFAHFPLWLELSGLPAHLNETGKVAYAWVVFHKIVQLDIARNVARPGIVEIAPARLAEACGLDAAKVEKTVKAMRKAAVLRAFLPENEEEDGLFQIITPVPTPIDCDQVRARHPDYFHDTPWPPRYAVAVAEEEEPGREEDREKIKKVTDLYFNVFSMKMNSLVLDQLQLISDRYDMTLIRRVFERARAEEARSLSFVLSEIRREVKAKARVEQIKRERGEITNDESS